MLISAHPWSNPFRLQPHRAQYFVVLNNRAIRGQLRSGRPIRILCHCSAGRDRFPACGSTLLRPAKQCSRVVERPGSPPAAVTYLSDVRPLCLTHSTTRLKQQQTETTKTLCFLRSLLFNLLIEPKGIHGNHAASDHKIRVNSHNSRSNRLRLRRAESCNKRIASSTRKPNPSTGFCRQSPAAIIEIVPLLSGWRKRQ